MQCLVILLMVGFLGIPGSNGWAFPGQTADELIGVLGPATNGFVSPPVPAIEAVRTGRAQLSSIYWSQATYDPLRSGAVLRGILVTTFDYRGTGLVERLRKDPPELGWKDLVSQSEVFLSFVSPQAFQQLLAGIEVGWEITSKTHQGAGVGYDLYSLTSTDGRFYGEISYSAKGEVPLPPDPGGQKPPTLNFWTRIAPVR